MATTLKKVIQSAPKMRGSLPIKAKKGATIKKAQYGAREQEPRLDTLYTKKDRVGNISTNRYVGRMPSGSIEMGKVTKTRNADGRVITNKDATQSAILGMKYTDDDIRKSMNEKKNGGKIYKAKDGKWMQKAAASIKKRGTAGKCTPITKPGCTGKAKALAKTFKAIAKKNKK